MSKVNHAIKKVEKVLFREPVKQIEKITDRLGEEIIPTPKMPELPQAPEPIDTEGPARQRAAAAEEERRRRLAAGRGSTIITGAQGVTGTANIGRKTLTGQ